jgi:hypothetical protein
VTGDWRAVHDEELHDLQWGWGYMAHMGQQRDAYREWERQLGRLKHTQFVDWQLCFTSKFSMKKRKRRQNIAPK